MLVLVFGLGISRLGLNAPRLGPVELDRAVNWAECLAQTEVGAGTPISLVGLGSAAQEAGKTKATLQSLNPPAIDKLKYIATEQVPIELDGADRAADFASGKPVTLPARSQIRVSKGEMEFGNGTVELYNAGGRFLLKVRGHARFRPAEGVNYIITLDHDVTVGSKQEGSQPAKAVLPVGTKGSLKLDKGEPVALTTLQPLAVRPWLLGTSPTLLPERASGHVGLADLAIEVRRPGLQLDGSSVALSACALSGGNAPQQAGVAGIRSQTGGTTTLLLSLPERALPAPFSTTYSAVEMALATSDGNFVGHGGFTAVDRGWAALIALAITGLLFG